jgi:hypothetical protein
LADTATVGKATADSAVKAGTTPDSDAVAAGAAFLAPPQQVLAATGARALALAGSLGSLAAVVEQQDDDWVTEAATDGTAAADDTEAPDAVTEV